MKKKIFEIFSILFLFFINDNYLLLSQEDFNNILKLEADNVNIIQNLGKAEFSGNVVINYSNLILKSDNVIISYKSVNSDDNKIISLFAKGNLFIKKGENILKGDNAFYDIEKNTITLEGNVTLNQKNNIISGKKLLFNTENGDIQMFGPVKTILNEEKNNWIEMKNLKLL